MKIIDKLFSLMGEDGMKHLILSAVIAVVLSMFLPTWAAALATLIVGVAKEYYDHRTGKGTPQVKDLICDLVGLLIGVL